MLPQSATSGGEGSSRALLLEVALLQIEPERSIDMLAMKYRAFLNFLVHITFIHRSYNNDNNAQVNILNIVNNEEFSCEDSNKSTKERDYIKRHVAYVGEEYVRDLCGKNLTEI
jgi:hypothetical protein